MVLWWVFLLVQRTYQYWIIFIIFFRLGIPVLGSGKKKKGSEHNAAKGLAFHSAGMG